MVNLSVLTVKELAKIAGVSVRTLHYYDEIGLLKPNRVKQNNYRTYDHASLLKLQQIMFFRELEFSLEQISTLMNQPGFDLNNALHDHREALKIRAERIGTLINTIDNTIENMKGKNEMTKQQYFKGFSDEQQAEYEKEAAQKWDPKVVHESSRRYKSLSQVEKEELGARGERITLAIRDAIPKGVNDPEVQQLVGEWQKHISFIYDCTDEILLGLGTMYLEDARFKAFYDRIHPDLAEFFSGAIKVYCANKGVTEF